MTRRHRDSDNIQQSHTSLQAQFASSDIRRHLALFYQSRADQLPAVASFVTHGLQNGWHCLYLADENDPQTIVDSLGELGVDVEECIENGDLEIIDASIVYGDGFDVETIADSLEDRAIETVENGYTGLWIAGENTWSFGTDAKFDEIIDFEVAFDGRCPELPVTALCQYNTERFDDTALSKALQTHEQIIYRGTLTENPYYIPAEEYVDTGRQKTSTELLLDQTRTISAIRRDLRRREERLTVINRVLRHNLRNELNVILGRTNLLDNQGFVTADGETHLADIRRVALRLVDLSEQSRHVDQTLAQLDHQETTLSTTIAFAVERVEREHGALLQVNDDECGDVVVDGALQTAVQELLSLAISEREDDGSPLTVTTTLEHESDICRIVVEAEEPVVSDASRRALVDGIEESLQHPLGLSAWVVRWVVEDINATLSVSTDGERGQVVIDAPVFEASTGEM